MESNSLDISIKDAIFEYNGKQYDCSFAEKEDKKLIFREAETCHKEEFESKYDKDSFRLEKARIFADREGNPIYLMLIYIINYKDGNNGRYACGNYYPIPSEPNYKGYYLVLPHLFQASICW